MCMAFSLSSKLPCVFTPLNIAPQPVLLASIVRVTEGGAMVNMILNIFTYFFFTDKVLGLNRLFQRHKREGRGRGTE